MVHLQSLPLSSSQLDRLNSLPDHAEAKSPSAWATVNPEVYTSRERFQLEHDLIFQKEPLPVTVSGRLPRPGMFTACNAYGVPLLLTRDKDGHVRSFHNVCQHRGTLLCEKLDPTAGRRIVCPYHAWTYDLEGRLIGVPQQETFDGLNKDKLRLAELPCKEAGGVIWVALNPGKADFSNATNAITEDFDSIGVANMHLYRRKEYQVNANWKLVMDAFLEGYHVLRLHSDSVARFFVDTPAMADLIGPHLRLMQGRPNFDKRAVSQTFEEVRRNTTFSYNIFPSGVLITSPTYVNFMVIMPQAYNRTTVEYSMLTAEEPTNEDLYRRSFDLMDKVFGDEDFRAATLCQKGLEAGGVKELVLGGLEQSIRVFHNHIESRLRQPCSTAQFQSFVGDNTRAMRSDL